jgi:hypothetical protein
MLLAESSNETYAAADLLTGFRAPATNCTVLATRASILSQHFE